MQAHRYRELPDPAKRAPGLPSEMVGIIRKACHKDPGHRYQDMEELRRDLLVLLDDLEKGPAELRSHGPLQVLNREHDLIRQFVDKLAIAAEQLERGTKPPKRFFEAALRFHRVFTRRFHHFKEEEVMFTRLAMKDVADVVAEIRAMQHQHERGREIMSGLTEAVKRYDQAPDVQLILKSLSAYISLMRIHIHTEEYVLYPLVARTFSRNEIEAMQKVFMQENKKLGGNMLETGQGLIQEMGSALAFFDPGQG